MVNPHFDREEIISEDIGFQGPHINENINVMDLYPQYTGQETWSPEREFGQHGEFEGWRSQEDPPSYRSDWQDYPADEFTGIQSNVPSGGGFLKNIYEKFGGDIPGLRGGFETPYGPGIHQDLLQNRKYDKYLEFQNQNQNRFNPQPGPWNEFNPSLEGPYQPYIPELQRWSEGDLLAKIYTSDMPGMINEGSNWNFMPGGDPLWDEVSPQGEAINQILQDPSLQKIIQGLIKSGETDPNVFRQYIRPDILEQLPPGAFTTINDFTNQQPITVI